MGNHRFRVSDMMPSSWFFKLKDASRYTAMKRSHHYHHHHHPPQSTPLPLPRRSSFYISTRERTEGFPHSPVNHKASDTQFPLVSPRKLNATNNPTAKPASSSSPASAKCSSATDSIRKFEELEELSELNLPPILTKPLKEELNRSGRRSPSSPRFGARSLHACRTTRKSRALSESLVVVKSSVDPQKDFRESMVEMIIENNIRTAKDLEELLMCYLSLNSRRYHGIILREFKQIWFEFLTH